MILRLPPRKSTSLSSRPFHEIVVVLSRGKLFCRLLGN